jgi:hypothetical protein
VSFDRVCSALVREPFNMTMAEIGKLTPYQVRNVYFRDEERDQPRVAKSNVSYKEIFWKTWQRRGLREHQIEVQWQEYLKEQKL